MNSRLDPRRWLHYLLAPLDGPLTLLILILVGYAAVVMVSASPERLGTLALNTAVAFSVMWIAAKTPPSRMMSAALPLYAIGVLLLIAVALFGDVSKGARRWLNIGVTRIQPSELLKIAMPLTLAWYFQSREGMLRARDFFIAAALLLLPVGLIAKQPDLGTSILVAASGFYVLFFAGLAWRLILPFAVVGIVGIVTIVAMGWMVSNLVVKQSKFNELMAPTKERPENKIDGPMAMLMALGRALANEPSNTIEEGFVLL